MIACCHVPPKFLLLVAILIAPYLETFFPHRPLQPSTQTTQKIKGSNSLGYVKGILAGSSSPAHLLKGGITTNVNGVSPPSTQLQKIAGFSCAAQRRYRTGEPQNLCGMPDIVFELRVEVDGGRGVWVGGQSKLLSGDLVV